MAVCLCIALFAGSGSVRAQTSEVGGQESEVRSRACSPNRPIDFEKKGSPGTASTEEIFEYFNGFIVHIKRGDFHHRILVCDVVIELNQGMKLPQERIELRKIIYNTLKELLKIPSSPLFQRGARGDFHPLDLYEIRRSLKEEIKIRLNNFMNDKIIKGVYFTKFVLL